MIYGSSLPADEAAAERETHQRVLRAQPGQARFFVACVLRARGTAAPRLEVSQQNR